MKRSFFQAAVTSILLYGCTTWTLTKRLEKKLDGNYTWMLLAILNKSWRQHPTRHELYGHLPPITKTIQGRRTRHAGHCWRSRDEHISDVLLWTPTHGRAKAGRPARTYIQQLCEDTGCCPEDLPEVMNDREKWRERVKDIRATSTTWWWWWLSIKVSIRKKSGNLSYVPRIYNRKNATTDICCLYIAIMGISDGLMVSKPRLANLPEWVRVSLGDPFIRPCATSEQNFQKITAWQSWFLPHDYHVKTARNPWSQISIYAIRYINTKVKVRSPDGDTEYFDIVAGVLQGDTLAPYLFIICLDYVLRTSIDKIKENGFELTKKRSRRYPATTITDADYADDIAMTGKYTWPSRNTSA